MADNSLAAPAPFPLTATPGHPSPKRTGPPTMQLQKRFSSTSKTLIQIIALTATLGYRMKLLVLNGMRKSANGMSKPRAW
jgi:hypothetical protein